MRTKSRTIFVCAAAMSASFAGSAHAVITYGSATLNTARPTGDLYNAGWQYEGQWNGFLGTPIAPNYFVTAKHIGGSVGGQIVTTDDADVQHFYTTTAKYEDPNTDLVVYQIDPSGPSFTNYAPMWDTAIDGSEVGKPMMVYGRGTNRGDPIYVTPGGDPLPADTTAPAGQTENGNVKQPGSRDGTLKGWTWGAGTYSESWGQNVVSGVVNGGTGLGQLISFDFDSDGVPNEGILSVGDSAGGVFIESNGVWKLAGINYGVDDPFRLAVSGTPFNAALFDIGGLYLPDNTYVPDTDRDVPASSYSTRISARQSFVTGITGPIPSLPEPAGICLIGAVGILALRQRQGR